MSKPHIVGVVLNGDKVQVTVRCLSCNMTRVLTVNTRAWENYCNGTFAQVAFPLLSANDREAIVSGTCAKCWDKMFQEEHG